MHPRITETTTLRDIALQIPAAISVLEDAGLDYCCGGNRTLDEATQAIGIRADLILQRIASAIDNASSPAAHDDRDWREATMTDLADHIERTHHAFVRRALARIGVILPRVREAHGSRHPEILQLETVLHEFTEAMHDHMVREERVVFPWLRRLDRESAVHAGPPWSVQRPISCMLHDHDETADALRTIRGLTNDLQPPPDACTTMCELYNLLVDLERDTHLHIHKENNILFPAGIAAEERARAEGRVPAVNPQADSEHAGECQCSSGRSHAAMAQER